VTAGTSACVDSVASSSVWPSGGARITVSAPMMPLAPGRFSTTTDAPPPSDAASASAT
jgi:hypothetical protein